jgi:uncharacterized protein (UPF0333 family)
MVRSYEMRRGQAALEYFILFGAIAVVAVAMLISYSTGNQQAALETYISSK